MLIPLPKTKIESGDRLALVAEQTALDDVKSVVDR
jgi:Trk K+ transport system NAD-binding subunit